MLGEEDARSLAQVGAGTPVGDLLRSFLPGEAHETLKDATQLISSGIVASLSLLELVNFVEGTFSVTLRTEDVGVSRMDSVDGIVALIRERAAEGAETSRTAE